MSSSTVAPCLLVASPGLDCPFFRGSVVLLVEHGDDGSLGFVVNKPSSLGFADVASQLELPLPASGRAPAPVMVGGPVQPESGWLLLGDEAAGAPALEAPSREDPSEASRGTVRLPHGLSLSASMSALAEVARGDGPRRSLLFLGYAGWGPGQLGDEFREGSWIPVDLDPNLLFDLPVDQRWSAALASLGVDPARIVTQAGGASAQA